MTMHDKDTMIYALTKFISIPSVSGKPDYKEDCRQAAIWLKKCLSQLGAESQVVRPILMFGLRYIVVTDATR
jgi:acetylornithine deacetylase/succinyl-diaminopimelate desuccinylase-like protein